MTKEIFATHKIDCEHLLGSFIDESHYDILIEEDTDVYLPQGVDGTREIACKFRKNYFTKEEQDNAYHGLKDAAQATENRGLAAGPRGHSEVAIDGQKRWISDYEYAVVQYFLRPINQLMDDDSLSAIDKRFPDKAATNSIRGQVWLRYSIEKVYPGEFFTWFNNWVNRMSNKSRAEQYAEAEYVRDNFMSDTNYAESVNSGIAGYFDRYPRIPYGRATTYTRDNYDKFAQSFQFLQRLNKGYKELIPEKWKKQKEAADKIDPKFIIPDTVFTTVTVNNTFRTACHRDAGDFSKGISNLLVLSNNDNFSGGYLIFPEYRVAVNIRPGDLLLVNNHEIIHGNTPIILNDKTAHRISLVCYLRENMVNLGSWEYEQARYKFVETRKWNEKHPLWRPHWNGTSPSMWDTQEWYDFLKNELGEDTLKKYHPNSVKSTLEALFE